MAAYLTRKSQKRRTTFFEEAPSSDRRQPTANPSCCPLRPHTTPLPEETSLLGVIYGVLLWADMNAATPLGARGRSVISFATRTPLLGALPLAGCSSFLSPDAHVVKIVQDAYASANDVLGICKVTKHMPSSKGIVVLGICKVTKHMPSFGNLQGYQTHAKFRPCAMCKRLIITWASHVRCVSTCLGSHSRNCRLPKASTAREITERPRAPSGVAAFMSAHSKTPYITLVWIFPLGKGYYGGEGGSNWNLPWYRWGSRPNAAHVVTARLSLPSPFLICKLFFYLLPWNGRSAGPSACHSVHRDVGRSDTDQCRRVEPDRGLFH